MQGRWISPAASGDLGLLGPAEVAALERHGRAATVEAGTLVAAAGSTPEAVLVVADGEVELLARLPRGRVAVAVVRAGGVVADIPVLLGAPMPFDALARRDTRLVSLSRERWRELLASSPALSWRWMSSIARRLDDDRRRLVVITTRPLLAQVAYLLHDLAEPDGDARVVRLSHTTLAHLLGARRPSVSRAVGALRARGLVATRYGMTVLLDEPGLLEVVGPPPLP